MSIRVFVIDTSYLLELFNVPGFSQDSAVKEVRERYKLAIKNNSLLFAPLPCVFELANHIADVRDGNSRRKLGQKLFETIESSVNENIPWNITPSTGIELLPGLFKEFAETYVAQSISLTDTSIIHEAQRLKKKFKQYSMLNYEVHIWTKDNALKAYEPDSERDPFLG